MINANISQNFQFAKVLSTFMVVFGHYYKGLELSWVPVTVGLLVFSFSSGYFTAWKYDKGYDKYVFWKNKISRIGKSLLLADVILLILFIIQGRDNLITWQTIVSAIGLTGILNWFHIPNNTPFGAGLWFLTLLYIFYCTYPLLLKFAEKKRRSFLFAVLYTLTMWVLNYFKPYGHALWLTSCGFVWGVIVKRNDLDVKKLHSVAMLVLVFGMMLLFNFLFNIKVFNFVMILIFSLYTMFFLREITISPAILKVTSLFNGVILWIYILHPYTYVEFTGSNLFDTMLSIPIVCVLSKLLEYGASKIPAW